VIDVLVAGGGPVGLATAIIARMRGLDVAVVEPREGPIDKACGEGLMPSTVAALARLGVVPEGRPFAGIRYVSPTHRAEARFAHGGGLGVRRTTLHGALHDRAMAIGVQEVRARVGDVVQEADQVHAAGLRARWLVAADGLHSPVRRGLALDRAAPRSSDAGRTRYGQRRHYAVAPWADLVEVHWSRDVEAYVTPVGSDLVGVAVLGGAGSRYEDALRSFPSIAARLAGIEPVGAVRGAGPLRQAATSARKGRVLLVGDAAGYVDALTGEGLATGLATAAAAVDCIASGRPQDYQRRWRQATLRYRVLTEALLWAAQNQVLRPHIVPAAARLPGTFRRVVSLLA